MKSQGNKILIVDDDTRNIFALSAVLRSRQYECIASSSVDEEIAAIRSDSGIGIILMASHKSRMVSFKILLVHQ